MTTGPNDYAQWYNEFHDDIVQDYNDAYGTNWSLPEMEEPDDDRWTEFLMEEYNDYCEAWEQRVQDTLEDEAYHAKQDELAEKFYSEINGA